MGTIGALGYYGQMVSFCCMPHQGNIISAKSQDYPMTIEGKNDSVSNPKICLHGIKNQYCVLIFLPKSDYL